jgi:hypothetical protein
MTAISISIAHQQQTTSEHHKIGSNPAVHVPQQRLIRREDEKAKQKNWQILENSLQLHPNIVEATAKQ